MSVNTHGKIYDEEVSIENIFNIINTKYNAYGDIKFIKEDKSELGYIYSSVYFNDGKDDRKLTIMHFDKTENEAKHIWLSLGCFGNSVDIIFNIVKQYGGFLEKSDAEEEGYIEIKKDSEDIPELIVLTYEELCQKLGGIVKII